MKIAVTCENNQVFQHFGHTPGFALFEITDGQIVNEKMLSSGSSGHGALATLLAFEQVDTLICGGIGGGAINALGNAGIKVIGGASGTTASAVYFCGSLKHHPDGDEIRTFITNHGKRVVELSPSPLADVGGILFI